MNSPQPGMIVKGVDNAEFCYFIESSDETGGEDGEHQAGEQLQEEAVEPHVQREHRLVDNL